MYVSLRLVLIAGAGGSPSVSNRGQLQGEGDEGDRKESSNSV